MIDGTGAPPLDRGAVLIQNGRIRAIGTEETVLPPEGAQVKKYTYQNKTVLPGLVDCHVHLVGIGDGRDGDDLVTLPDEVLTIQAAHNARAHLFSGVTTVRDCGAKNRTTFLLRRAMEMGITVGPRLVLAGRPVAITGGHLSYFGIEATGPTECRTAVRQLLKEGADFIKITATGGSTRTSRRLLPSFAVEELTAICDEAHKFGRHAAAHCLSSQGMVNALDAGIDTIIHAVYQEPDGTSRFRPEIAERIVRQGVFVNETLATRYVDIATREAKKESEGLSKNENAKLEHLKTLYEARVEDFAKMRELGVVMAAGSDSGWGNYRMGSFQHETDAHVAGGMSPMEAIVAATRDSARSSRVDGEVGTLEPGKHADVLVVDGDPSKNIKTLWNVVDVFLGGDPVKRGNRLEKV